MNINHVAIWAENLEVMRTFYETFFQARAGKMYVNQKTQFSSYILHFSSGARLELMQMPVVQTSLHKNNSRHFGYAHIAISVGSKALVEELTDRLEKAGYPSSSWQAAHNRGWLL